MVPDMAGPHATQVGALGYLPRTESVDLTNDPRMFAHNALEVRLGAFRVISVAAVFMAGQSAGQMKQSLMSKHMTPVNYAGLIFQTLSFVFNLFGVVVILQQIFQTYRLFTASSIGFDLAKSYYLSPNITLMRHLAVKAFLNSLPLFVLAMACKSFGHLRNEDGSP